VSAPNAGEVNEETRSDAPPGLSLAAVKRVADHSVVNPMELEKTKLALLTFLASDLFQSAEVVLHYLVASADPRHSVGDAGMSQFKKTSSYLDWNDSNMSGVVQRIYELYLGGATTHKLAPRPKSAAAANSNPADLRTPAGVRLRIRLLSILLQSLLSPDMFPFCIQVTFKTLFGDDANEKLRFLAAQFLVHIIQRCSDSKIEVMAPLLLSAVNKLLDEPEQETKLRCLTYVALGQLAKCVQWSGLLHM
jgi:proteasome component ECM29